MPRSRSSGALSIEANDLAIFVGSFFAITAVIAAVSVVLPWSMCPIVPMFTCGFDRLNFSFAMSMSALEAVEVIVYRYMIPMHHETVSLRNPRAGLNEDS